MADLKGTSFVRLAPAEELFTDAVTGAKTLLHLIKSDRGVSFADALETLRGHRRRCERLRRKVEKGGGGSRRLLLLFLDRHGRSCEGMDEDGAATNDEGAGTQPSSSSSSSGSSSSTAVEYDDEDNDDDGLVDSDDDEEDKEDDLLEDDEDEDDDGGGRAAAAGAARCRRTRRRCSSRRRGARSSGEGIVYILAKQKSRSLYFITRPNSGQSPYEMTRDDLESKYRRLDIGDALVLDEDEPQATGAAGGEEGGVSEGGNDDNSNDGDDDMGKTGDKTTDSAGDSVVFILVFARCCSFFLFLIFELVAPRGFAGAVPAGARGGEGGLDAHLRGV